MRRRTGNRRRHRLVVARTMQGDADDDEPGTRLELDPAALGYPVCAYVRIRPVPGQVRAVADLARRLPQVVECHRVTGEDCVIAKVHLPGLDRLDEVLDQFLACGQTTTSIVQSKPVEPCGLRLPAFGSAS